MNIRLVCLDLAGTTVSDDGAVERAFMSAWSRPRVLRSAARMMTSLSRFFGRPEGARRLKYFG